MFGSTIGWDAAALVTAGWVLVLAVVYRIESKPIDKRQAELNARFKARIKED